MGDMTVIPFDVDASACSEIYLYRFGISGRRGGLERGLHGISIAWGRTFPLPDATDELPDMAKFL